ncbi:insulin-like growth factor-binding protein-related protein 1 isoform X1 [Trichogramma pretiosum]|uniref:insulin-like growth factor-binding protein-related protein 1 isoform X1 n=1 Tax=Trichogramma pretiosum TaxID=7493 RepID=UPI0006C95827|nr:insulin-like growth factor-binding protein-related protein 1 isoform X1 [Trichogramma pretiosum]XP_014222140.1 insulin-like growth factor-binding protein-related protein 1 isoform X1 [Trichogramma pretiosum]
MIPMRTWSSSSSSSFSLSLLFLALIASRCQAAPPPTTLDAANSNNNNNKNNVGVTETPYADGCRPCSTSSRERCPTDPATDCLLGTVPDACGCCPTSGVCARLEGETCWDEKLRELLPAAARNAGRCAGDYSCRLRHDLEDGDEPEAVCSCRESRRVCGSDNRTYANACTLRETALRIAANNGPSLGLWLAHEGPCPTRPRIYSAPESVADARLGQRVALNCEARGVPLPDIFWEFHSADGRRVLRYETEDRAGPDTRTSRSSDGAEEEDPEDSLVRATWLVLDNVGAQHIGVYHCIANNSLGLASAWSIVNIFLQDLQDI